MLEPNVKDIKETLKGYPVKNLRWKKSQNVIVGQVKCPVIGRENLFDGYIMVVWRKNGKIAYKEAFGNADRNDLTLKMI